MSFSLESKPQLSEGTMSSSRLGNQSPAVDFIDNRLHQYHEVFMDPPTQCDVSRGEYVPTKNNTTKPSGADSQRPMMESVDGMKFWKDIFTPAIQSLKTRYPSEPKGRVESGFSIRASASWNDVWEKLTQAQEGYDSPEGRMGSVRKGFRRFVDGSQKLSGAVALVPDTEFTTPVISVLKALLTAAKTTTEIRNAVTGGLEEIEQHFGDIEEYITMFPNDNNIVKSSTNMVVSILKAIEDVIGYYIRNRKSPFILKWSRLIPRVVKKAFAIIFNGDEYRETLTSSLSNITASSKTLLHQAQNSNMWQNHEMMKETSRNSEKLEQVLEGQNAIKGLLEQYELNLTRWKRENAFLMARIAYYEQNPHATPSSGAAQATKLTIPDLLGLLGKSDAAPFDMEHIVQIRELIPVSHREIADALATKSMFADWIKAPVSRKILIHGEFEGIHYVSALSLFCTSLHEILEASGKHIPLIFFCGRHMGTQDGGQLMIRNLTTQLLQLHQFDTRDLDRYVNLSLVDSGDIDQLLVLFRFLVLQLSDRTVFCIVDGIRYYERGHFLSEMSLVLRVLLDLADDANMRGVFKILVASPTPTTIVRQAFSPTEILSMAPTSGLGQGSSTLRLARNLKDGLGDSNY